MRLGYLDPPYFGMCSVYEHNHPENGRPFDGRCWDEIETHQLLIDWACERYDGWALSLSSTHLYDVLPLCPSDVRIMAWCKPWASFKPNVNPAYTWEPVIVHGGRKRGAAMPTVRDYVLANATMQKGVRGAKPRDFSVAVFEWLNVQDGDEFEDVFVGSGAVQAAFDGWSRRPVSIAGSLFE